MQRGAVVCDRLKEVECGVADGGGERKGKGGSVSVFSLVFNVYLALATFAVRYGTMPPAKSTELGTSCASVSLWVIS